MDRRRSSGGRERSAYSRLKTQRREAREVEFVEVPNDLKGHVIGKGGCMIKEIKKASGAFISSEKDDAGFTVSGNDEQRACAKRLILEKVQEIQRRNLERAPCGELVEIPSEYKGLVIGKGGDNLRDISTQTGTKLIRKEGEVYIVSGTEDQRQKAKLHIKITIAAARIRGLENESVKRSCVYIDDWNLPEDCELKLVQVEQKDRMVHPGWHAQYRLKPVDHYVPQASCSLSGDPTYLSTLQSDALESLRYMKQEMKTKEYLKADMWCHFGTAIIRGPDEEEANEGEWTINEATKMFQSSNEGNFWKAAFKEGVNLDEKILEGIAREKTPEEYEDYAARYDFAFLTPLGSQIRFKVWLTKKNVAKKLGDIPIPLSDVKNILDEIHFEDEATRSRCRGWLVLPSRKYLQADILFPGCEFDCRLTIRGRTDSALVTDYVPKEEARQALSRYLSELTLTDEDDIELPEGNIPEGFHLIHKRCSKRTVYETRPGFTIILSKESSWRSDVTTEQSRKSTDLHLHCSEWDELLSSGDWQPEIITEKLPEFFRFVKEVQGFVLSEMKT